ncbi:MAG: hypothetical protein OFPI_21710 [Osedax symbiont Rs2]|nr:MAG: hypothetical protein OFPI_21710 [Osedax symbiont Rs2]
MHLQPLVPTAGLQHLTIAGKQGALALSHCTGSAIAMVFVHADPGSSRQWVDLIKYFSARHGLVAYDTRGAGASAAAENDDYSFQGRSEDLAQVVDVLGYKKIVIVAHSGGAAVAMQYATDNAERVAGLFLLDPPADPQQLPEQMWSEIIATLKGEDAEQTFLSFIASIAGSDTAVRAQIQQDAQKIAERARPAMTQALSKWDPAVAYRGVTAPVYMLTTPENIGLVKLWDLQDGQHSVSHSSGHWIQLDDPDLVIAKLTGFLNQLEN